MIYRVCIGVLFLDKGCTLDERTKNSGTGYYESFRISILLIYQFDSLPLLKTSHFARQSNCFYQPITLTVCLSGRYAEIIAFSSLTAIRRAIIKLTVIEHF